METRGTPGGGQRAYLRQPECEVVLRGVTDRAVHLQGGAAGEVGGVRARHLRRRDVATSRGGAERHRGAEQQWAREVEGDGYVGEQMLHRLERADRLTELMPLLGIRAGPLEQGGARALLVRRRGERPHVEGAGAAVDAGDR